MMLELLDIEDLSASPELWTKPLLGSLQPVMLLIQRRVFGVRAQTFQHFPRQL